MNRSSKFNFFLPQNTDPIDVSDFNSNFETIDANLLTKAQSLTDAQKAAVRANVDLNVANNLTTEAAGSVLDARQGKVLGDGVDTLKSKATPILYQNTTLAAIIADLNSKYGNFYCVPFTTSGLTDGSPPGCYIAMRCTAFSNGVRLLYYSASYDGFVDVTKVEKVNFGSSVGGAGAQKLELITGSGNTGESEIRIYTSSTAYYVLNMSTAGLKYGYDNGNGTRTYYKTIG